MENIKVDAAHFGTVINPIQMMMDEHTVEGNRFRKIEELSNNYTYLKMPATPIVFRSLYLKNLSKICTYISI